MNCHECNTPIIDGCCNCSVWVRDEEMGMDPYFDAMHAFKFDKREVIAVRCVGSQRQACALYFWGTMAEMNAVAMYLKSRIKIDKHNPQKEVP